MSDIKILNLAAYEQPEIKEDTRNEWVEYGEANDYYNFLIDRSRKSTTNSAVINNISRLIYGRGLHAMDAARKPSQYAAMRSIFSAECLRKVIKELKMLGAGHFQVHYDEKHTKVIKAYHIPTNLIRPEKCNAEGDIEGYYYSDNWEDTRKFAPKRIPAFGTSKEKIEILCIKDYAVGVKYFGEIDYLAAVPYAILEEEISDYLINEVQNGFSGTKVVNFNNGVPDREKQLAIKNDVMSKLSGSYGEKTIIAFNNNAESATTVTDIPLNDAPQHYSYLSEECSKKIMLTHRVTSPLLLGLSSANGFSSNADEIENASRLFNNVVIQPYQNLLIDSLDAILAVNDISLNLYFKTIEPLEFMDLENVEGEEAIEEQTGIKEEEETTELEIMASKVKNKDLPDEAMDYILDGLDGEIMNEDWEIADVREYDEENIDIEEWAGNIIETKLATAVKRKTPIENNPNRFSVLDKSFYKVRYRYAEVKSSANSRKFCKEMMNRSSSGVVYRIEDIDAATKNWSASKFKSLELPMHNNKPFSLFRFKGGVYCGHIFEEVLYKVKKKKNKGSDKIKDYDEVSSIPKSQKPTPRGHKDAKVAPTNMPNNGHHPNYKK